MSDPEDPKSCGRVNMECLVGYGFLLFGLGTFCLVPGCLLMATYATSSEHPAKQIGALILFVIGNAFLLIGIFVTIYWCRVTGYHKIPKKSEDNKSDNKDSKPGKDKGKGKGKSSENVDKDDKNKGKDKGKDKKTET